MVYLARKGENVGLAFQLHDVPVGEADVGGQVLQFIRVLDSVCYQKYVRLIQNSMICLKISSYLNLVLISAINQTAKIIPSNKATFWKMLTHIYVQTEHKLDD